MNGLQIVMKSLNPVTLCMGFASVCVGCAASSIHGYIDILPSLLCLVYALLIQCTGNIGHRYYDEKYGYGENVRDGISNEDEDGRPTIYILYEGVKVFYILALTVGIAILITAGWWALIPGITILAINRLNNHGKHPWNHTVLYPLITFILFGPICVISTSMVNLSSGHTNALNWTNIEPSVVLSIIIGLLAMNSHIVFRASQSLTGLGMYTSLTGKYGIKATAGVLTVTTLIYSILLAFTPYLIELSISPSFMILPILSMTFSFYIIYLLLHKRYMI